MGKENDVMLSYLEDNERFADYPMRLICVNEIENCSKFQTSLRALFRLLPHRKDKGKSYEMLRKNPEYENVDRETALKVSTLMGVNTFMEREEKYKMERDIICVRPCEN